MLNFLFFFLVSSTCISYVRAQVKFASLPSPAIPLFVKTPYLNTWLQYANGTGPGRLTPQFWEGRNLGYEGLIRVDGETYQWMGSGITDIPAAQTITQYISPTRTVLVMTAGPLQMNVTWLSPIEPDDWAKESFPFTYVYIDIQTTDGNRHDVQLYTHVTGEWVAPLANIPVKWGTNETNSAIYHQIQLNNTQPMRELAGTKMAGDVTIYFAAQKVSNLSWESGADSHVSQTSFSNSGRLANLMNTTFRSTNAGNPALSFSHDLSKVTKTASPIVWTLGAVRDPVISYKTGNTTQLRSAAFWSKASSIGNSISEFLADFPNAVFRANDLDSKIMGDGQSISPAYADLLALCLRQVMASLEITISQDDNGHWNENDVKTFIRDMGSTTKVNAVDHIYATFSALLYLNASLAGTILSPLLDLQSELGAYSAVGDIGNAYPIAWGNVTYDHAQDITNGGDMLFMLAAHAKKAGDTSLVTKYYNMLKRWADFLVTVSLQPGITYTTANEFNYPNMSNLALQGIVGIHAMSNIGEMVGNKDDADIYYRNASSQLSQWQNLAFQNNRLATAYQAPSSSWSVMYNLYSAKMLGLEVDQQILDSQSHFYAGQAVNAPKFGFSYTSEANLVRSYWLLLTSATTTSVEARDIFIKQVHDRFFWNGTSDFPFPSTYDKRTGASNGIGGKAGPTLGAAFAHLALNIPDKITTSSINSTTTSISSTQEPSSTSSNKNKKNGVASVVGGVFGAIFGLSVLVGGMFLFIRKRRKPRKVEFRQSLLCRDDPFTGYIQPFQGVDSNIIYNPMQTQPPKLSDKKSKVRNLNNEPPLHTTPDEALMSTAPLQSSSEIGTTAVLRKEVELMREELAQMRAARTSPLHTKTSSME